MRRSLSFTHLLFSFIQAVNPLAISLGDPPDDIQTLGICFALLHFLFIFPGSIARFSYPAYYLFMKIADNVT